jgi:hypothetical protein
MAPLCAEFGISRKTGYKIFDRYKDCGVQAFTDRSRRPYRQRESSPRMLHWRHNEQQSSMRCRRLCKTFAVDWLDGGRRNQRSGVRHIGKRLQPFTLLLRSLRGMSVIRCVSPVGEVSRGALDAAVIHSAARRPPCCGCLSKGSPTRALSERRGMKGDCAQSGPLL